MTLALRGSVPDLRPAKSALSAVPRPQVMRDARAVPLAPAAPGTARRPSLRLFVAVEVPADVRHRLVQRAEALEAAEPELRVVRDGAVHLTLKFLGNVDRQLLPCLLDALAEAARVSVAHEVELVGLGAFPRIDAPKVVWIGVGNSEPLEVLASHVEAGLEPLGFAREKRGFHPHVTIGRVKEPRRARALEPLIRDAADERFGTFRVSEVVLFESVLHPSGARYTALARSPLMARGMSGSSLA